MKYAQVYFEVNMSNGHTGLSAMLEKPLKKGELAIFINKAFDTVKILAGDEFLAHYKHATGRIEPMTIKHLPNYLSGGEINYNRALKAAINEWYEKR